MVTGGAGFLGGHLCEEILRTVDPLDCLHVIDDLSSGSMENLIDAASLCEDYRVEWGFFGGSVADPGTWLSAGGSYDLIIHAASPASPIDHMRDAWATISANLVGAYQALGRLRQGGRILFLSTSEVYGDPEVSPQPEDYHGRVTINGPRAPYDEGKRVTEALLCNIPADYAQVRIARIFNTYGPRMRPSDGRVVSSFITQALAGRPLTVHGDGSQTRSFCWVHDTVRGLVQLALANNDSLDRLPVNIGNPDEISVLELAHEVCRIVPDGGLGPSDRIVRVPAMVDDPTNRRPDIDRAWHTLRWRPQVDWRQGVAEMVEYFRSQMKKEA
jgi:nucleoside-diphosphate-sugar epimerase